MNIHGGGAEVGRRYRDRNDIGNFGVYLGNWGGHKTLEEVRDHILTDLISRGPASVIMACEVDEAFIAALRDPASEPAATWVPHAVPGELTPAVAGSGQGTNYADRNVNMAPWWVAATSPYATYQGHKHLVLDSNRVIVAAR